ncbi:oxidoreductase [bacterium K02(2017)]|nr:oxidoreductase [bacterium K02(2017)]
MDYFNLSKKVVVITGAGGLLGQRHAEAVAEYGAYPVLIDIQEQTIKKLAPQLSEKFKIKSLAITADITSEESLLQAKEKIIAEFGEIDVLINNAAHNPQPNESHDFRFENLDLKVWEQHLSVGLTGAFLCAKIFGVEIAKNKEGGSIINISSDLGLIAPDQRLYAENTNEPNQKNVKPVTYSVVKTGLIGLTRYLATYWPKEKVRCNALCPGGVYNQQDENFVKKVSQLIPLGRMADVDEYKGSIVFLCSKASSYMTGSILAIDGGRTSW